MKAPASIPSFLGFAEESSQVRPRIVRQDIKITGDNAKPQENPRKPEQKLEKQTRKKKKKKQDKELSKPSKFFM